MLNPELLSKPQVLEDTASVLKTRGLTGQTNTYYKGAGPTLALKLTSAQVCAYASDANSHLKDSSQLSSLTLCVEAKAKVQYSECLCIVDRPSVKTQELDVVLLVPSDLQRDRLKSWEMERDRTAPAPNAAILEFQEHSETHPPLWRLTCWLTNKTFEYLLKSLDSINAPIVELGVSSADLYSMDLACDPSDDEVLHLRPLSFGSTQSVGKVHYFSVKSKKLSC